LDAAARAGRPVLLTADHGHIWDRGKAIKTRSGESARYRTGEPDEGELLAIGDRVLLGDATLVAPYREDIRYTDRKDGYHGGFSAAEMVVPVLTFVPVLDTARHARGQNTRNSTPRGWQRLTPAEIEPVWWSQPLESTPAWDPERADRFLRTEPGTVPQSALKQKDDTRKRGRNTKTSPPEQTPALFGEDALAPRTLGDKVTATSGFHAGHARVPRAPDAEEFAALIDALAAVGGTHPRLPVNAASRAAGGPKSHPRAVRFLKMVGKVLNVEAYPI